MEDCSPHARKLQRAWLEAQRLRASIPVTSASSKSGPAFSNSFSGSSETAFTPPPSSGSTSPSRSHSVGGKSSWHSCVNRSDTHLFMDQSGKVSAANPIAEMYHDSVVNLRGQTATDVYIAQWLADEQLESHHAPVTDLLAFQVIHNDLEGMISEVGSNPGMISEVGSNPGMISEVGSNPGMISEVGSNPGMAPPPPSGQAMPSLVASSSMPPVDWMSTLLIRSSLTHSAGSSSEFPVAGSKMVTLQEVTDMLLECGAALARQNAATATVLVDRIRKVATPDGTPTQRLAHYFVEALIAKLNGTAADLFTAIKRDRPSLLDSSLAFSAFLSTDPSLALAHHFGNSVLMEVFEGAERVHIIDYGIQNGHQWPSLMQALAYRLGGPPRLRITGIELPQPGLNHDAMVRETGRRLAKCAAELRMEFEYKAFSDKWEDVPIKSLELRQGEVLAVSSVFRLRHLLDDSVVLSNPRRTVLERIAKMGPKVFVTGVVSLAVNAPFLMTRLQESIPYCACYFDSFEATICGDSPNRKILEREMLGREILNMIACEGMERRERAEAYYQWHWRLVNAGFEILSVKDTRFKSTRNILKAYHDDWTIGQDEGWILSGWRGRVQHGYSAWKPTVVQRPPPRESSY